MPPRKSKDWGWKVVKYHYAKGMTTPGSNLSSVLQLVCTVRTHEYTCTGMVVPIQSLAVLCQYKHSTNVSVLRQYSTSTDVPVLSLYKRTNRMQFTGHS